MRDQMKVQGWGYALCLILGGLVFSPAVASPQTKAYMRITISQQGAEIRGASIEERHQGWIELEQVSRETTGQPQRQKVGGVAKGPIQRRPPRGIGLEQADVQSPEPAPPQGQPQQRPPETTKVVKQADIASGQLQNVLRQGQKLFEVVIEFEGPDSQGMNRVQQRLKLRGVRITSLSQRYQAGNYTEEVRLAYDRYEQEDFDASGQITSRTGWDFIRNMPI